MNVWRWWKCMNVMNVWMWWRWWRCMNVMKGYECDDCNECDECHTMCWMMKVYHEPQWLVTVDYHRVACYAYCTCETTVLDDAGAPWLLVAWVSYTSFLLKIHLTLHPHIARFAGATSITERSCPGRFLGQQVSCGISQETLSAGFLVSKWAALAVL